jgi:hypothetical protein
MLKAQAMKTCEEVEVQLHALISAGGGSEWLASRPGRFTHGEKALGTRWIGSWVRTGIKYNECDKQSEYKKINMVCNK